MVEEFTAANNLRENPDKWISSAWLKGTQHLALSLRSSYSDTFACIQRLVEVVAENAQARHTRRPVAK